MSNATPATLITLGAIAGIGLLTIVGLNIQSFVIKNNEQQSTEVERQSNPVEANELQGEKTPDSQLLTQSSSKQAYLNQTPRIK